MAAHDVVWVSERERFGRQVNQSPLSVVGLMREGIFARRPAVLTSATLTIGGNFDAVAASVGLTEPYQADDGAEPELRGGAGSTSAHRSTTGRRAFSTRVRCRRPAATASAPTRWPRSPSWWAAGGRTLGLFASQRAAEAAALHCRRELPAMTILCQGDAQLGELTRTFVAELETSLFGTLSLWQGVDVPGDTCRLVIIDKIPFPRPDDPLLQARQRAVAERGGNGFMTAAATHAALLLAQGSGRLIRRLTDRAWWRCSTRDWSPPATAAFCARPCPISGRPPTVRWRLARCSGWRSHPRRSTRRPRRRCLPGYDSATAGCPTPRR